MPVSTTPLKHTKNTAILYRTHQHWIVPGLYTIKYVLLIALPGAVLAYFFSEYSWLVTGSFFILLVTSAGVYQYYLWENSWISVGNQKIILSVQENLRTVRSRDIIYAEIKESLLSRSSLIGVLLGYGAIFFRSVSGTADTRVSYIPKAGKLSALINTLLQYNERERQDIDTIETLHHYHQQQSKGLRHLKTLSKN